MTDQEANSIWTHIDVLTPEQRNRLVVAAVTVLDELRDDDRVRGMPSSAIANQLKSALADEGVEVNTAEAERLSTDAALAETVSTELLEAIANHQKLAEDVADTYIKLGDMMVVDFGLLVGGTILLLVLKVKRVRYRDTEVEFYDVTEATLKAIRSFLSGR